MMRLVFDVPTRCWLLSRVDAASSVLVMTAFCRRHDDVDVRDGCYAAGEKSSLGKLRSCCFDSSFWSPLKIERRCVGKVGETSLVLGFVDPPLCFEGSEMQVAGALRWCVAWDIKRRGTNNVGRATWRRARVDEALDGEQTQTMEQFERSRKVAGKG